MICYYHTRHPSFSTLHFLHSSYSSCVVPYHTYHTSLTLPHYAWFRLHWMTFSALCLLLTSSLQMTLLVTSKICTSSIKSLQYCACLTPGGVATSWGSCPCTDNENSQQKNESWSWRCEFRGASEMHWRLQWSTNEGGSRWKWDDCFEKVSECVSGSVVLNV